MLYSCARHSSKSKGSNTLIYSSTDSNRPGTHWSSDSSAQRKETDQRVKKWSNILDHQTRKRPEHHKQINWPLGYRILYTYKLAHMPFTSKYDNNFPPFRDSGKFSRIKVSRKVYSQNMDRKLNKVTLYLDYAKTYH